MNTYSQKLNVTVFIADANEVTLAVEFMSSGIFEALSSQKASSLGKRLLASNGFAAAQGAIAVIPGSADGQRIQRSLLTAIPLKISILDYCKRIHFHPYCQI